MQELQRPEDKSPASTPDESVGDALARVLASSAFARSPQKSRLLSFLVDEELAGRGERLQGSCIAIDVYGRDADFDPGRDSVVRSEARRLRQALEHYYLTAGCDDPLRIDLPKGGYRPRFVANPGKSTGVTAVPGSYQSMPAPEGPVIAVLPFKNLSDEAGQEQFVDGVSCAVTTALRRFEMLRVIARQSSARFRGTTLDARAVGAELGARFLLTGSVQKRDAGVRVRASLTDTVSGEMLWANTYEQPYTPDNLFHLEDELTCAVVAQVADAYGPLSRTLSRESDAKPMAELSTYEAFMRVLVYYSYKRLGDFAIAREAMEVALAREPEHGTCWAALSMLHAEDYLRGISCAEGLQEQAWALANRSLSLSPESVAAHLARSVAAYVNRRPAVMVAEAEQAIALNPNDAFATALAGNLIGMAGELERAIDIVIGADNINAFRPSWQYGIICQAHYLRGEYEEALGVAESITHEAWPMKPLYLGITYGQMGDLEQGRVQLCLLQDIEPGFTRDPAGYIERRFIVPEQMEKAMEGLAKLLP